MPTLNLDNLPENRSLIDLISVELEAFHCTRAIRKDIESRGLTCFQLEERISYVRNVLSGRLDGSLVASFEAKVREYLSGDQLSGREGTLWFCLNRSLFEEDSGCDDFFKYFGGESIYRVALGDQGLSNVKTVLEEIGEPLLVTALIPFNQLARFQQDRISDFIARNHSEPCEAFVKDNIPPQKIVKIEKWNSLG